jgi:hypothetical protein
LRDPGFRVAPAIAGLPGMTVNFCRGFRFHDFSSGFKSTLKNGPFARHENQEFADPKIPFTQSPVEAFLVKIS